MQGKNDGSAKLVHDVMTREVQVVHPDDTLDKAAERMKSLNVGPLPVCDGDRLHGMITDRDITVRAVSAGKDPQRTPVRDVMTDHVVTVFEDEDVRHAAKLMEEHQIRRLVVLNRDKRLAGVVSLGDLAVDGGNDRLSGQVLEQVSEPSRPSR
jgi:CBS domain-containing protein